MRGEEAEEGRIEPQDQRYEGPNGVQNHLAAQVVADLDFLFVLVARAIDRVIALGLEKEMAGLAADHGYEPTDQRRLHRIEEHGDISDDEADGTQEVQGLIDAAVVVVTVIVPALSHEFRQKTLHVGFLGIAAGTESNEANIRFSLHGYDMAPFSSRHRIVILPCHRGNP